MKIKLNWALFLLTAASYVAYPVWRLPLPPAVQWGLLNFFVLLSAAALYSPLEEASLDAALPELKELWPAILTAALVCLPFWLTPLPTGSDDQSHAGPAAWLVGRLTSAIGLDIRLLPLVSIPLAGLLAWAAAKLCRKGAALPRRGTAVLLLAAAANLWFFADLRWGLAGAIGRYETILRYPPLSKFLYLPAYLLVGVNEAAPRAVQFCLLALTAVYLLRFLKLFKAGLPARAGYLVIAFFPTFFNLSISSELEAGTVLFFTAAIYHFIKAADGGLRDQFLKCAFWAAAGFFYKQLPLGLVLSFIPALALLWLRRAEKPAFAFGLKLMALPLATGLPFILLGAHYGIRNSGLVLSNLFSPALMTLNLKVIYMTCGAPIALLLAASAAYALYARRGQALWLLLYLSGVYYLMISATEAVGYVRHAQPFYIALVVMLGIFLSGLYAALPRRAAGAGLAALLSLFVYQAAFARAPYHRKTAFNYRANVFPYAEAARYFKPGQKIYAPMEVEPSHFYLAKYGLAGKLTWDRTLPPEFSAAKAAEAFRLGNFDYLLLPYSPFSGVKTDFRAVADELTASGRFLEAKTFDYYGNKLILLKPCAE